MELARQFLAFVDDLRRDRLPQLKGFLEERLWREALARPSVAVSVPPESLWSTARAACFLDCSADELRDRVRGRRARGGDRRGEGSAEGPLSLRPRRAGALPPPPPDPVGCQRGGPP